MSESAEEHVDCSETMYRIMEYLDGEMTPQDRARIAEHLQSCQPCLDEHEVERMVKALVKRSCSGQQAPPALRTTILQSFSSYTVDGGVVQEYTEIRYDG